MRKRFKGSFKKQRKEGELEKKENDSYSVLRRGFVWM